MKALEQCKMIEDSIHFGKYSVGDNRTHLANDITLTIHHVISSFSRLKMFGIFHLFRFLLI
jgi:hypothetical protein